MNEQIAQALLNGSLSSLSTDKDKFPVNSPLLGILANDCRLRSFQSDEVVVRKGDYGNSAFFIVSGGVYVVMCEMPGDALGHRQVRSWRNLFGGFARVLGGFRSYPEMRTRSQRTEAASVDSRWLHLQDFPELLLKTSSSPVDSDTYDPSAVSELHSGSPELSGEVFGEIAAMGRTPRTATVLGGVKGTKLLEIRWQGLRDIRRYAPAWREMIDQRYRKYSLELHLKEAQYTRNLNHVTSSKQTTDLSDKNHDRSLLSSLAQQTHFYSYGDFEWQGSFKEIADVKGAERLKIEPVITRQGDQTNGLVLVRSGFVRVRRHYNHGEKTISYMGKGQSYGLQEIYCNWKSRAQGDSGKNLLQPYRHTLSAVSYVNTLFIPTPVVEALLIPNLNPAEIEELEKGAAQMDREQDQMGFNGNLLEFLVENRAINGSAAMLIDRNRCTGCDDCVRACATTHDNNPRFIRHGSESESDGIQLTHACMHCADPVCMIGCPTGAIHRDENLDLIVINDVTCIGCSTCANNCPYNNIQMVDIRDESGYLVMPGKSIDASRDEKTLNAPIQKATKCDLCETIPTGPACQYACPHDALIRVDLREPDQLQQWLRR